MKKRILAGSVAAILLVLIIFYGPMSLIRTIVIATVTLSILEFESLFFTGKSLARKFRMCFPTLFTVLWVSHDVSLFPFCMSLLALCVVHVIDANQRNDFPTSTRNLSLEILGLIYVVGLFGFLMPIADFGRHYFFLFFLMVFMGDVSAYFIGTYFGKHPLAGKISPKKSVEGSIAAVAASVISTALWLAFNTKPLPEAGGAMLLVLSPLVSVAAQVGDLFESVLKRSQDVKDSGTFLPGHGGMLDRIDGFFFSAPIFYYCLKLILKV